MEIKQYLSHVSDMMPENLWYRILKEHGRHFPKVRKNHKFQPGEQGQCFHNALHLALVNEKQGYRYVEGYAMDMKLGVPLEHAWVIDDGRQVIDTTWHEKDRDVHYYGVVFQPYDAAQMVRKLKYYGIGGNLWRDRKRHVIPQLELMFPKELAA